MARKEYKITENGKGQVNINMWLPVELVQRINADVSGLPHISTRSQAITNVLLLNWSRWIEAERKKINGISGDSHG